MIIDWNIVSTGKYERDLKWYEKKRPHELAAVLGNLEIYFETLKNGVNPMQIKAGFIHDEPEGMKALDQKGGQQKVKLQQTRLYIFPEIKTGTLHLLAIGDKNSQRQDIQICRQMLKEIKSK